MSGQLGKLRRVVVERPQGDSAPWFEVRAEFENGGAAMTMSDEDDARGVAWAFNILASRIQDADAPEG